MTASSSCDSLDAPASPKLAHTSGNRPFLKLPSPSQPDPNRDSRILRLTAVSKSIQYGETQAFGPRDRAPAVCAGKAGTGPSLLGETRADLSVLAPAAGEQPQSRQTKGILTSPHAFLSLSGLLTRQFVKTGDSPCDWDIFISCSSEGFRSIFKGDTFSSTRSLSSQSAGLRWPRFRRPELELPFLFLPVPGSLSTKEKGSRGRKARSSDPRPTKGSVSLNQLHPEAVLPSALPFCSNEFHPGKHRARPPARAL